MLPKRTVSLVIVMAMACVGMANACTHDFDAFEPRADEDAAAGAEGGDAAPSPTSDAATGGADAGCSAADSCGTTAKSCKTTCETTRTTCRDRCNDNRCRSECDRTRDDCTGKCTSTCRTCAGAACTSVCN